MILIVSSLADDHTVAVLDRLAERDADVRLLDLSAFPTALGLAVDYHPDGGYGYRIADAAEEVDLSEVNAVWWRRPQPFELDPSVVDPVDRQFAYTECSQAVNGLFHVLDAAWMNDPTLDTVAGHKLYQLRVAGEAGLEVPRTRVTNDPASARAFAEETGSDGTVYKAFIAQPEAWRETRVLTPEEAAHLDDVALAPVIFQEYVPADVDLRITVVGEEVFAVAIDASDTDYPTDYRMNVGEARVEPHDLPTAVRERLRAFMDRLGLVYGAIDMRLTPDGRYVFLEVNPSGLWLFVEEPTGLPITDAVVDWFLAHDAVPAGDVAGVATGQGTTEGESRTPEDGVEAETEEAGENVDEADTGSGTETGTEAGDRARTEGEPAGGALSERERRREARRRERVRRRRQVRRTDREE